MVRLLLVSLLVLATYWSVAAQVNLTRFPAHKFYAINKKDCVFPFRFRGKEYNDCTNDGDNGPIPWCSLTTEYKGLTTYCYDFRRTNLTCASTYLLNRKIYFGCAQWSKSSLHRQCKTNNSNQPNMYCLNAVNTTDIILPHRRRPCDMRYLALSEYHTMW